MFISFLYMFQATMCPSSGGTTILMRHLVLVILYGWLSAYQTVIHNKYQVSHKYSCLVCRQLSIQNNKYQVSHKYSCFPWWWAHSHPKHT